MLRAPGSISISIKWFLNIRFCHVSGMLYIWFFKMIFSFPLRNYASWPLVDLLRGSYWSEWTEGCSILNFRLMELESAFPEFDCSLLAAVPNFIFHWLAWWGLHVLWGGQAQCCYSVLHQHPRIGLQSYLQPEKKVRDAILLCFNYFTLWFNRQSGYSYWDW